MSILPVSLTPGVTTGHVAHHLDLHARFNNDKTWYVPAGSTLAQTQAIVDDAEATYLGVDGGGGLVLLAPGEYNWTSGTVRFKKTGISFLGAGPPASTIINYTGTGACLKFQNDPTTVQQQGVVGGFTILGSSSASAMGIHCFDTGVTPSFEDLVIHGFTGANGYGIFLENDAIWNERFSCNRVRIDDCKVGVRMYSPTGSAFNSFGYARVTDLRLGVNDGQKGIQAAGSALVYNGFWDLQSNGGGGTSTLISVEDTANWNASIVNATGEALGTGANVAATATFNVNGFWGPGALDTGNMQFGAMWNSVGHIVCGVNLPPAVAMGANAGAGVPAAVVKGSPLNGDVTFGSGTGPVAGALMIFTFGWPFARLRTNKRPSVIICPTTRAAAALGLYVEHLAAPFDLSGCVIGCNVAMDPSQANTVYGFSYHILG